MKVRRLHRWDVSPAQARRIQDRLRKKVLREENSLARFTEREPKLVAGVDVAFIFKPSDARRGRKRKTSEGTAIAGVIVYRYPDMKEVERVAVRQRLQFPYVPGLLSFREAPALLAAFRKLKHAPDVVFVDGQGYAHPLRFGIACHLGLLLNRPTVGCAKSRLIGDYVEPPREAGNWAPLTDKGEVIGAVLRTRSGVKPIYVSTGYRMSLPRAIALVMHTCDGFRIPRPTREADHWVEAAKRGKGRGAATRQTGPPKSHH